MFSPRSPSGGPPVSPSQRSDSALLLTHPRLTQREALGALDTDVGFDHPEWGHGTVADALRWVAHEVVHHDLDVRHGLAVA
jgi:hypothetical protein